MKYKQSQTGFTIVELLIVIVVIAVLAAITVVAYAGIQQRARETAIKAEVSNAKKLLGLFKAETGNYPMSGNLASAGVVGTDAVGYQYTSDGATFCLTGTIENMSYKVADTTGPISGGCPGHGHSGVSAIRNLALDPKATGSEWFQPIVSNVSRAMNVTWNGKSNWSRFTWNGTGATTVRMLLNLSDLSDGESYTSSFLVGNDGGSAVSFSMDLADGGPVPSFTVNPGEQKRVSFTASRSTYTSTFRFIDMNLQTAGGSSLLITDAMVTKGTQSYEFAHGDLSNWVWEGTPNKSTSAGPPL